jgi:hydroxymethylglutaryl-CoA lyase
MYMPSSVLITECPRDAMQGLSYYVPTEQKIAYIEALLKVGFDTLDFGSFVSPKAIPQMRDTSEVLSALKIGNSETKLLAIIANRRGAEEACKQEKIRYLGYPFSVSETFQMRNTNATIFESLALVEEIQKMCEASEKQLVVYLSMAFGNPYGDAWNADVVIRWVESLKKMRIERMALSDTIGVATPESIEYLFSNVIIAHPEIAFGAHFHTTAQTWREKVDAAFNSGCARFDGALFGFGGCPMAKDELTGNMPTENLISYFMEKSISSNIDLDALADAQQIARQIFHT